MAQEPLILPAGLDAVQQDGIRRAVCGMAADQARRVLDALGYKLAAGGVNSPVGLTRWLCRQSPASLEAEAAAYRASRVGAGTAKNNGGDVDRQQRIRMRELAGEISGLESMVVLGGAADWSTTRLQALKQQYRQVAGRDWGQ
ncbi:MAG: hypothetical protein KDI44_14425 [Thiothrix sp.]|nr:hypothetical protein [Thiothrix sp.]